MASRSARDLNKLVKSYGFTYDKDKRNVWVKGSRYIFMHYGDLECFMIRPRFPANLAWIYRVNADKEVYTEKPVLDLRWDNEKKVWLVYRNDIAKWLTGRIT
jgi:hypothetical protein